VAGIGEAVSATAVRQIAVVSDSGFRLPTRTGRSVLT